MSNLIIVFIGLSIIFYIFFVLGTTRTAILRGEKSFLWFIFSLVFVVIMALVLFI